MAADRVDDYAPHEIELLDHSGMALRVLAFALGVVAAMLQSIGHVDDARRLRGRADEFAHMAERCALDAEVALGKLAERVRQGMDAEEGPAGG
jgi:hypothetical protein